MKFKTLFQKKSKDKVVPGKRNVEYLWTSSCLFAAEFIVSNFVLSLYSISSKLPYELRSVNALN